MAKFFNIEEEALVSMNQLMRNKRDNEYVVLNSANGFTDIAQYSSKYQNLHLVTVRSDALDWTYRLA